MESKETKRYRVYFKSYQAWYGSVDIEAESEEEAKDLAWNEEVEWDEQGDIDDVEIDGVDIVRANGCTVPCAVVPLSSRINPTTGYKGSELMLT